MAELPKVEVCRRHLQTAYLRRRIEDVSLRRARVAPGSLIDRRIV